MQAHDTLTIQIGDAIVHMPAGAAAQTYLKSLIDQPVSLPTFRGKNIPKVGEYWPEQGGIYAGLMRGEYDAPDYHLIVPGIDASHTADITWGGDGKDEPGAKSSSDGLTNTSALCKSKHSHPAAEWAAALTIENFNDFYLPSRRELRLCWVNVPELFDDGWYWSSTQSSANGAWYQYFVDGNQGSNGKDGKLRARAVRRFISNSVI